MHPLISIITITFNASSTIRPTMNSIHEQSFKNFNHFIIDGASTDDTVIIARQLATDNCIIISEPDHGLYDAMNKGLNAADGQYVIFLNSGDAFHSPSSLQLIADAIKTNSFPDVVYGQTQLVDTDRRRIADRHLTAPDNLTFKSFSKGMLVCHQAFVAKREIAPLYDLQYRFSADYDWCIKILRKSRENVLIPHTIIDYLSEGITTTNHKASLKERFRIMRINYGLPTTIARHLQFIPRYIARQLFTNQKQ